MQFTVQGLEPGESVSRLLAEQLRRIPEEGTPVPRDEAADDDVAGKDAPTFDIDATKWTSISDFYGALLAALGAPEGYARNINALLEWMLWDEREETKPPYSVRIIGSANLPKDVRDEVEYVQQAVARACAEFRWRKGRDVVIRFETYP